MLFIALLLVLGGGTMTWVGTQIYVNTNGHTYGLYGFIIFLCCCVNSYFVVMVCLGRNQLKEMVDEQRRMERQ